MAPHENPLVTNATLRQMYRKMVEMRLLEEHLCGKLRRKAAGPQCSRGQEACRVGSLQGLAAGDLVMDSVAGGGTGHLVGVKLSVLLRAAPGLGTGKVSKAVTGASDELLAFVEGAEARLLAAMGAGVVLKTIKKQNVLVVYVEAGEASKKVWRQVLKFAGELELPILFVVLPKAAKNRGKVISSGVCGWAQENGVPGIPVDANDAVALYRVAQESMGRIRGDGGPALIECVPYQAVGGRQRGKGDPIVQLKGFLVERKICTSAWLDGVELRFRKRLGSTRGS